MKLVKISVVAFVMTILSTFTVTATGINFEDLTLKEALIKAERRY